MNHKFKRLMLLDAFWNFMYGLAAPFITIFFNEFGGFEEVGVSVALLYIVQGLVSFIAGNVLERFKAKQVLLFSQLAEGLRILLFIFAQNVYWVYLTQFIGGITIGFISPAYNKLLVRVSRNEGGRSFGERSGITTMAMGVSALIAGILLNIFGYAPIFLIWSISEIIYGLYVYFRL